MRRCFSFLNTFREAHSSALQRIKPMESFNQLEPLIEFLDENKSAGLGGYGAASPVAAQNHLVSFQLTPAILRSQRPFKFFAYYYRRSRQ